MALELKDLTSNQNDFTVNSGVTQATDAPASLTGAIYSALVGPTNYLTAPDSASLSITSDMTLEFWLKNDQVDGSFYLLKYTDPTDRSFVAYGDSSEFFTFINSADGANTGFANTTTAQVQTDGAWHHYALVYDHVTPTMVGYRDAAAVGTWSYTSLKTAMFNGTSVLKVANNGSGAGIKYCDVRIWNTALAAGSISSRYQTLLAGTETNLVSNWTFQPFSRTTNSSFMKSGKFW